MMPSKTPWTMARAWPAVIWSSSPDGTVSPAYEYTTRCPANCADDKDDKADEADDLVEDDDEEEEEEDV